MLTFTQDEARHEASVSDGLTDSHSINQESPAAAQEFPAAAREAEEVRNGDRLYDRDGDFLSMYAHRQYSLAGTTKVAIILYTNDWSDSEDDREIHVKVYHAGMLVAKASGTYTLWIRDSTSLPYTGTRCWGDEIEDGVFFEVDEVLVARGWRGKGVGKLVVQSLLGQVDADFIFVLPDHIQSDLNLECEGKSRLERQQIERRLHKGRLAFYRSLGFRRLGGQNTFCLARDPTHPSHQVPKNADYDPPEDDVEIGDSESDTTPADTSEAFWHNSQPRTRRMTI